MELHQEGGRILLAEVHRLHGRYKAARRELEPLTVRDQLGLRRIAEQAGAPLIAPSRAAPSTETLHAFEAKEMQWILERSEKNS